MPNQKNQQQLEILKEKVAKTKSVAIIDFAGTSVNQQVQLRRDLREVGGEMFITKNTLIDIALGKGNVSESLEGMNAIVLSYEDEVSAFKKLFDFQKKTEKLKIKQGMMADKVLSADEVEALSKLPGRNELMATLISRIQGPAYGLVGVLKASQRGLLYALKAIADKQGGSAA
jgi:large subunit ribosomal protein L10